VVERLTRDEWGVRLAEVTALRGTCARRKVGAVAVDIFGRVLATGYNGPARGLPHCTETRCAGASFPSGHGLEHCEAIHAEQNMIASCRDINAIRTVYLTVSPCESCLKLLLATPCDELVFRALYPGSPLTLWESAGRRFYLLIT
jgi:dCMP deaminase